MARIARRIAAAGTALCSVVIVAIVSHWIFEQSLPYDIDIVEAVTHEKLTYETRSPRSAWWVGSHLTTSELQKFDREGRYGRYYSPNYYHHPADTVNAFRDVGYWELEAYCIAAIAMFVCMRLRAQPRIIVMIQLALLCGYLELTLWQTMHVPFRVLGTIAALATGTLMGTFLRSLKERDDKAETQLHQIQLKNKELVEARVALVKNDEVERRVLAGDLHDQVLNDLKALRQSMQIKMEKDDFTPLDDTLSKAMTRIREVMDNLSPADLEHLGLIDAIEACLDKGAARAGFKVRFRSALDETDAEQWDSIQQTLIYRLVQETVNNIVKHSGATIVHCDIGKTNNMASIKITDDGKGIDSATFKTESRGLRYMRQRADLIGGTIAWRKGDGDKGTVVEIGVPLKVV